MTAIVVPIWELDDNGNKKPGTAWLSVHNLVAEEVSLIFQEIYNSDEKPVIYMHQVGGARFSDHMRHAWGCAIDINPLQNAEMNFNSGGKLTLTCGYGWFPKEMFGSTWCKRPITDYVGKLDGTNQYSIGPYSAIVRAFANYGWGWGGSGNNVVGEGNGWNNGNNFDFMHFSVLKNGG